MSNKKPSGRLAVGSSAIVVPEDPPLIYPFCKRIACRAPYGICMPIQVRYR